MRKLHSGFAPLVAALLGISLTATAGEVSVWRQAEDHARKANLAVTYCLRYAEGWLQQADPQSGLLPRTLNQDGYWNAKDCAADNFPFLLLTGEMTGQHHIQRAARAIFEQERRLCPRVDHLPDTYYFDRQGFSAESPKMDDLIFGAAEYAKDGLLPIIEWSGPGPWLDRAGAGRGHLETCGFRHALRNASLIRDGSQRRSAAGREPSVLDDRGCAVSRMGLCTGRLLSAAPAAAERGQDRAAGPRMRSPGRIGGSLRHRVEDRCIQTRSVPSPHAPTARQHSVTRRVRGRHAAELVQSADRAEGQDTVSDGWGYVYNAFLTVALVDEHRPYRDAVEKALQHAHTHLGTNWEGYRGDGYADSVEGAINLLNRIPCETAWPWVEASLGIVHGLQRADGIAEGWYGDGNSAHTMMMHALWLTQGITARPWRKDVNLGAAQDANGSLRVYLSSEWAWHGTLRCDIPRHKVQLRMPLDYPRINQFPQWFTVDKNARYQVQENDGPERELSGDALIDYPVTLPEKGVLRLSIRPADVVADATTGVGADAADKRWRDRAFASNSAEEAATWSQETRAALAAVLGIDACAAQWGHVPLESREVSTQAAEGFRLAEVEISVSPDRRIRVLVGTPERLAPSGCPAVVCIGGHGSKPSDVFDANSIYRGFAAALARGAVVVSPDIAYHERDGSYKTLMGQRTWDLMRCVDYLCARSEVDPARIGGAGLSLGGEMAMWLGAWTRA